MGSEQNFVWVFSVADADCVLNFDLTPFFSRAAIFKSEQPTALVFIAQAAIKNIVFRCLSMQPRVGNTQL